MRTWSDTRQAATGGKPRVDAHLSADQRQAHPRAAVAVNPLASSLHGPSASQSVQAQSFKSLRAQQAGGRTTRTDGRTPAPEAAGFGDSVLESLGHWTLVPCIRQGKAGDLPSPRHPSIYFFRRLDRQCPQQQDFTETARSSRSKQRVGPRAEGAPSSALWRLVGSLATCSRDKGRLVVPGLGHIGTVSKAHTGHTKGPALQPPKLQATPTVLLTCW